MGSDHVSLFFESDSHFDAELARRLASRVSEGWSVVVVAAEERRRELGARLGGKGRLCLADATALSSQIVRDQHADRTRFHEVFEPLLDGCRADGQRQLVHQELSALLFRQGMSA